MLWRMFNMYMVWLWMGMCVMGIQGNLVCISNLGQWSDKPEEKPRIIHAYSIGSGSCAGPPPITFTPDCWNGILPHPCRAPRAFDKIAMTTCQARGYSNPKACQYVGYALRRGICSNVPSTQENLPVFLDCGEPFYWGWERITSLSQLKKGWQGMCVLQITLFQLGTTVRLRNEGRARHRKTRELKSYSELRQNAAVGEGQCIQCLTSQGQGILYEIGKPSTCTQFDLASCVFGRTQYHRCNGTKGVICYSNASTGVGRQGLPSCAKCIQTFEEGQRISVAVGSPDVACQNTGQDCVFDKKLYRECTKEGKSTCYNIHNRSSVDVSQDPCAPCIATTMHEGKVTQTLVYHTMKPPTCGTPNKSQCTYQGMQYRICNDTKTREVHCYEPRAPTKEKVTLWVGMRGVNNRKAEGGDKLVEIGHQEVLKGGPATFSFQVCEALSLHSWSTTCGSKSWQLTYRKNHKYLCTRNLDWGKGNPNVWLPCAGRIDCSGWGCVCDYTGGGYSGCPGISSFRKSTDPDNVTLTYTGRGDTSYGFGIDGTGSDPITYLTFTRESVNTARRQSLFHSFYQQTD